MLYAVIVFIFFSVWTLITYILFSLFYKEKLIAKLKYYDEDFINKQESEIHKNGKPGLLKIISSLIRRFKFIEKRLEKFETELLKADISITAEELVVIKIFSSLIVAFFVYAFFKNYIVAFIFLIATWNIPRIIVSYRKKERIRLFDNQLNEGITIISNSLKAGYSFMQSLAVVTEEMKDPFSKEFKELFKEMSLGIPEEITLKNLLTRMESEDLKLVINAILIQKNIGGNLSEVLDNISETIRERQKIKNELKTLTAQGKLSGVIISIIPVFLGFAIYLFNKEYILLLFTSHIGLAMVAISILNQVLGVFMIKKIISIDF